MGEPSLKELAKEIEEAKKSFPKQITCYKALPPEIAKRIKDITNPRIFFFLSYLSFFILAVVEGVILYLIYPRLYEFHPYLAYGITFLGILFLIIIFGGLSLIFLTVLTKRDFLYPHSEKSITVKVLYPITYILGGFLGFSRDEIGNSFVTVNNAMIEALAKAGRISSKRVLILLPHCIQWHKCPYRITIDIKNCAKCGKCDIKYILDLAEKYGIENVKVATGGTLARKIIVEVRPTVIVAVACERDLVEGIIDAYPIPVYGILNIRINGPCFDTLVPIDELDKALGFLTNYR